MNKKNEGKPMLAVELFLLAALIVGWIVLLFHRTCGWDLFLLIIWAIVIAVAAVLVFRAEWKVAGERRRKEEQRNA